MNAMALYLLIFYFFKLIFYFCQSWPITAVIRSNGRDILFYLFLSKYQRGGLTLINTQKNVEKNVTGSDWLVLKK